MHRDNVQYMKGGGTVRSLVFLVSFFLLIAAAMADETPSETKFSQDQDLELIAGEISDGVYEPPTFSRTFAMDVLAEELSSPDGLAIQPDTGRVFVSEEDNARILMLGNMSAVVAINQDTPIYEIVDGRKKMMGGLRGPEGIAFATNGDLYVVEDVPGGRLLRFPFDEQGRCRQGEAVHIPGLPDNFAWEGVDTGPNGEILLAGSDIEALIHADQLNAFSGMIVYRDTEGAWWIPHQRLFSSFSSVCFSKSRHQALYTCEVTGEIGWIDLRSRRPVGGNSSIVARTPEGLCVLPNGMVLIAQENGSVLCLDPSTDRHEMVIQGLGSIESVIWDPANKRALVTEDGGGRVLAFSPDLPYPENEDMLDYASYHPIYSPQYVPSSCPNYLSGVFAMGGLDFRNHESEPMSFKQFTTRVPLIAADAKAVPLNPDAVGDDPIERIQFIVFNPNKMIMDEKGPTLSLAAFAAKSRSGKVTRTLVSNPSARAADFMTGQIDSLEAGMMVVPQPAAISVSPMGIATVQFMGLGKTPDYSVMLDPRNPDNSRMIVFNLDGSRQIYRLETPPASADAGSWIIAYTRTNSDVWARLGSPAVPEDDR